MRAVFANEMGWTPILTVNVGAGRPEAACNRAGLQLPERPNGSVNIVDTGADLQGGWARNATSGPEEEMRSDAGRQAST